MGLNHTPWPTSLYLDYLAPAFSCPQGIKHDIWVVVIVFDLDIRDIIPNHEDVMVRINLDTDMWENGCYKGQINASFTHWEISTKF